ncbi:hypothetical protein [Phytohalomonas tamaricis]|uniref:hypothetical protein n=1 Tax=Phytohalomonas tamaricis TaxID=2081032 RepID=UPI000D0B4084|nr:hypothetical protein [Phytohalomonas tamaricis]
MEDDVWNWLNQHTQLISLPVKVGTFVVWWGFMQMLLNNYLRQRSAKLVINRGNGQGIDAVCVVSNMSQEPVFIEALIGVLETSEGRYTFDLTDFTDKNRSKETQEQSSDELELRQVTRQGPLSQGQYVQFGSFRELIEGVTGHSGIAIDARCISKEGIAFKSFELRLIALYGPDDNLIGAMRRFHLSRNNNGDYELAPRERTKQFDSRWKQRKVCQWIKDMA